MSELQIKQGASQPLIQSVSLQGFLFQTSKELDIPEIPEDVTELDDNGLMHLFAKLTAYSNFLSAQLACAFIDERNAENSLEFEESLSYIDSSSAGKKETVALIKARIKTDPKVMRLQAEFSEKYAYRKIIEVMTNNVEKDTALISRELSRRIGGQSATTRGNNRLFA